MPSAAIPGTLPSMPGGWQLITTKQIIHKAFFRDRSQSEAELFVTAVLSTICVCLSRHADPVPAAPDRPEQGSWCCHNAKRGRSGASIRWQQGKVIVEVQTLIRNSSTQYRLGGRSHHDSVVKIPVQIHWTHAHLPEGAEGVPGHSWTACAHDASVSAPNSFPYYTTALLPGLMTVPLSPTFEVSTLAVNYYSLHLTVPLRGLRNKLEAQISSVGASSGVTVADLARNNVAEASRRAVGGRAPQLQTLNPLQGTETEVQKLGQMTARLSFRDAGALPRVNEKGKP